MKTLFGKTAQSYDQSRRQLIPHFDDLYVTVLDIFPQSDGVKIKVLDLGAGTGLLSGFIAEAFPNTVLHLVDISPEMLDQAQARFANQPDRVSFQVLDFVNDPLSGSYDVVVSALALHHAPQDKLKAIFAKIYQVLVPGGMFIHFDQTLGTTPENEARYHQTWLKLIRQAQCSEDVITMAEDRMKADKTATLKDQLTWLEEVGFQGVDCWYKHYRNAVYSGYK
ncbi:MAG: class I SAM-dependent methyltransferase [Chloroflexota bacterium]